MEILAIWVGAAILTAIAAGARGRSPVGWFLIGLLCSFMGLIAVLIMRPLNKNPALTALDVADDESLYRDCPFCAEPVKKAAVKCKHCGSSIKREKNIDPGDANKPAWTVAFSFSNDSDYVRACSQLSDLDLPLVLNDDTILVGPYLSKSEALRIKTMLTNEHRLCGELETSLTRV